MYLYGFVFVAVLDQHLTVHFRPRRADAALVDQVGLISSIHMLATAQNIHYDGLTRRTAQRWARRRASSSPLELESELWQYMYIDVACNAYIFWATLNITLGIPQAVVSSVFQLCRPVKNAAEIKDKNIQLKNMVTNMIKLYKSKRIRKCPPSSF